MYCILDVSCLRLSCCRNAFIFCVYYLCLIGRVYVFYEGNVDKRSLYKTRFHCNILSKHHHIYICMHIYIVYTCTYVHWFFFVIHCHGVIFLLSKYCHQYSDSLYSLISILTEDTFNYIHIHRYIYMHIFIYINIHVISSLSYYYLYSSLIGIALSIEPSPDELQTASKTNSIIQVCVFLRWNIQIVDFIIHHHVVILLLTKHHHYHTALQFCIYPYHGQAFSTLLSRSGV
jgi:hypothetical protein